MTALGLFLVALSIGCLAPGLFGGPMAPFRRRAVRRRLTRFVPCVSPDGAADPRKAGALHAVAIALSKADPSYPGFERTARMLGMGERSALSVYELYRLAAALVVAMIAALLAADTPYHWPVAMLSFVATLALTTEGLKALARSRRRNISDEIIFGTELITIFVEGGQSLDQALRSLCDVCGRALPRLEAVQRRLVADLDNGVPYAAAFERWADHLAAEQARPLAALFTESLMQGTELAPQLRQFTSDLTEQRLLACRASIGAKSAQLTVVMILFFLPAILGFVAAPAVVSLTNGLGAAQ